MNDVGQREDVTTQFPGLDKGTQGKGMRVLNLVQALDGDVCGYAIIRVCWVDALHTGETYHST